MNTQPRVPSEAPVTLLASGWPATGLPLWRASLQLEGVLGRRSAVKQGLRSGLLRSQLSHGSSGSMSGAGAEGLPDNRARHSQGRETRAPAPCYRKRFIWTSSARLGSGPGLPRLPHRRCQQCPLGKETTCILTMGAEMWTCRCPLGCSWHPQPCPRGRTSGLKWLRHESAGPASREQCQLPKLPPEPFPTTQLGPCPGVARSSSDAPG